MEESRIIIHAEMQRLILRTGLMKYASDTVNYVKAEFSLGRGWQGFDAVQAIWRTRYETISVLLDEDGCCMVPQEVLARKSRVQVNLVGFTADEDSLISRLTTYPIICLDVDVKAEISGNETAEVTPSQFEQFVGTVAETATRASEAATNASESATQASASAAEASESATNALASENEASSSANSAALSANDAGASAESASQSAISASESADTASSAAQDAAQSANAASQSASSASTDATRAETARAFLEGVNAEATTLAPGSQATASYDDGVFSFGIPQGLKGDNGVQGPKGASGNGISSAVLNSDYTLTLTFTDGTSYTTPSIRGEKGEKGDSGEGGGGGSVTVDTEMSITSSNPVQNNVIKSYVDRGLANKINVGDALCVVEFTYDSANDKYTASKSANQIYEAWTNGKYVIGQISHENNYAFPILRGLDYEESNGEYYPIAQFVLDNNQITSNYTMAYSQLVIMMHRVGPGIDDDEIRYTQRSADAVPTSRKVNGKILYNDITLTASDVGALPSSTVIPTYTAGTGIDITNGVISIDLDNAEGSNY